jgi:uncharacterized protein (TIGR02217 family)
MSFHEVQFPPDIAYGATGGPAYATAVVEAGGGNETRNVNWAASRGKWNVASGLKNRTQVAALIAFFRARRGKAYGFRFKDWIDYQATAETIGTGDGVATTFQLVKAYTSGGVTETRTIKKPVTGTVRVYKDAVEQLSGWSVNTSTGVVTFTSPPADDAIITADFEFDVPVRFDTDVMSVNLQFYNLSDWGEIPVVELRL